MDNEKLDAEIKQAIVDIDGEMGTRDEENYAEYEKLKRKMKNEKKAIIIVVCIVVAIALIVLGWYLIERHENAWELKTDKLYIEYGLPYYVSIDDVIDTEKYPNVNSSNTEFSIDAQYDPSSGNYDETEEITDSLPYNEKETYNLYVQHHSHYKIFNKTIYTVSITKQLEVTVQDTTAPVFDETCPAEIKVEKDSSLGNLNEIFTVEDFSDFELSIDESTYDLSTPGEYQTEIIAEDSDGNTSSLNISIIVTDTDTDSENVEDSTEEIDSAIE